MTFAAAARMIQFGLCDAAVVCGVDSLCLTTLYGFHSLQLTAEGPCRPFDAARDGISIGEAGGFALLERGEPRSGITLLGYGESSDAHHMSSPHPEGLGARAAMDKALATAGLTPSDIDYINLHGTATKVGDAAEDKAVAGLFGNATPCSSTKGLTGHTLGASGIVEAVISALGLLHGLIPASPTTRTVDPNVALCYLAEGAERPLRRVMSNSFGFGGSNCSLIFGRA
jgi:3-oxoacyl-[acyl-carrier-protein] synthase-1